MTAKPNDLITEKQNNVKQYLQLAALGSTYYNKNNTQLSFLNFDGNSF